jgi:hypothetical protein
MKKTKMPAKKTKAKTPVKAVKKLVKKTSKMPPRPRHPLPSEDDDDSDDIHAKLEKAFADDWARDAAEAKKKAAVSPTTKPADDEDEYFDYEGAEKEVDDYYAANSPAADKKTPTSLEDSKLPAAERKAAKWELSVNMVMINPDGELSGFVPKGFLNVATPDEGIYRIYRNEEDAVKYLTECGYGAQV